MSHSKCVLNYSCNIILMTEKHYKEGILAIDLMS